MASYTRPRGASRRSGRLLCLLALAVVGMLLAPAGGFVSGVRASSPAPARVLLRAEENTASEETALVKVSEDSKIAAASLLGGIAGLLVGGVWIGAALFAATSYIVRQEDNDVAKALKGVAASGLEAVNFGAYMNDKYEVTGKVGGAIKGAVGEENTKVIDQVVDQVKAVEIKDTVGKLATGASDAANKAVTKAIDVNKEYKITDQIAEKVQDATKNVQK
mmetsp:Transcript_31817/g.72396  ORF Transcript_31817/g.72396 Transcript_31817/m.72396 type:complete len:220 (-) Transcript_31817:100-759(-)|eukprot:CAMPEP_0197897126 /NCGR_PEP_ID=MMETSP1439-20131203/41723_1 /TAXON_ID=66791 /ORGANISM="Gonyaulax spinifera, Strain CCMP409" /LENGTH=219 /DNA_ID=CAMNT_0043517735 /DNA_START=76 /DNA_END=735 /DNA_ORIENTATION=-